MENLIVELFQTYPTLGTILMLVLAAHGLALAISNLTPTPRDDRIVGKVYKVVEWVAGVLDSAKTLPGQNRESVKNGKVYMRIIQSHRDTFEKDEEEDE